MKSFHLLYAAALLAASACTSSSSTAPEKGLKDMRDWKFTIGAAVNTNQVDGTDSLGQQATLKNFNSIVAENCMKCEKIHPEENLYAWDDADAFVKFGTDNDLEIIGHCLIWHSQCAPWFLVDENGNDVDSLTLKQRMRDHITEIMTRYKGKIKGWDVVNEAILDDGSYRQSGFYRILGEEYIPYAFSIAQKVDPDAELYINDFSMAKPGKRNRYVKIINDLKERGIRIDGIGMQTHIGLDYPDFIEYEKSLNAYAETGIKVMATELDMSVLPTVTTNASVEQHVDYDPAMNPFPDGLPEEMQSRWNQRMGDLFDIFDRNADKIARVTVWGVSDGDSWRNGWPMPGRTDYPTLLDREYKVKPFINQK